MPVDDGVGVAVAPLVGVGVPPPVGDALAVELGVAVAPARGVAVAVPPAPIDAVALGVAVAAPTGNGLVSELLWHPPSRSAHAPTTAKAALAAHGKRSENTIGKTTSRSGRRHFDRPPRAVGKTKVRFGWEPVALKDRH
jgi:hypothetical protein